MGITYDQIVAMSQPVVIPPLTGDTLQGFADSTFLETMLFLIILVGVGGILISGTVLNRRK